jgi:hypothetical protein
MLFRLHLLHLNCSLPPDIDPVGVGYVARCLDPTMSIVVSFVRKYQYRVVAFGAFQLLHKVIFCKKTGNLLILNAWLKLFCWLITNK